MNTLIQVMSKKVMRPAGPHLTKMIGNSYMQGNDMLERGLQFWKIHVRAVGYRNSQRMEV